MTLVSPPLTENPREDSTSNGVVGDARMTIAVPCYRDDAVPLIEALAGQPHAAETALIVYDDGSGDDALAARHLSALKRYPGEATLIRAHVNCGRAVARNRLVARAQTDWVLMLDADMIPDTPDFLRVYLEAVSHASDPHLVAGGFTVKQAQPTRDVRLHYAQARASDCLTAAQRAEAPGRFVFTSNILVHKDVLRTVAFDESFQGWGWEDVDWGLRVAEIFNVVHIDNTATHLGLEPDHRLIEKFGTSGANFARLAKKHPEEARQMPIMRAAKRLKPVAFIAPFARAVAAQTILPDSIRLAALKVFRAAVYSRYI